MEDWTYDIRREGAPATAPWKRSMLAGSLAGGLLLDEEGQTPRLAKP